MALLNKDEIVVAWNALSSCQEQYGWRYIPISTVGKVKILAARECSSNLEAIIIGFPTIELPQKSKLPQGNGFESEIIELHDGNHKWIALIRQINGSFDLFSMMASDIAVTLSICSKNDERQLLNIFLGRIHAWQEFMKKGRNNLNKEEEQGLFGELSCLENIIKSDIPMYIAVESWKGPSRGIHDFEIESGSIEVKSSSANSMGLVTINSLEQLDNSIRNPLFLYIFQYKIGSAGNTLPSKVNALRELISSDPVALEVFNSNLLLMGYSDAQVDKYTRGFIEIDNDIFLVDDSFPKLTRANIPNEIRKIKYEMELKVELYDKVKIGDALTILGIK